jgi:hypothetical protein
LVVCHPLLEVSAANADRLGEPEHATQDRARDLPAWMAHIEPTSEGDGRIARYRGGAVVLRIGHSTHAILGPIYEKWRSAWGEALVGYPVSAERTVGEGRLQRFRRAGEAVAATLTIYWSAATGACWIHGELERRYQDLGGPTGSLGFPTSDMRDTGDGIWPHWVATFQHGLLTDGPTGLRHVPEPFCSRWRELGEETPDGPGLPASDVVTCQGDRYVVFVNHRSTRTLTSQRGWIYERADGGRLVWVPSWSVQGWQIELPNANLGRPLEDAVWDDPGRQSSQRYDNARLVYRHDTRTWSATRPGPRLHS